MQKELYIREYVLHQVRDSASIHNTFVSICHHSMAVGLSYFMELEEEEYAMHAGCIYSICCCDILEMAILFSFPYQSRRARFELKD